MSALGGTGGDLEGALENINVPSYVIDSTGVIRWTNPAAERVVGDVIGRQFTSVVEPHDVRRARESFASKVVGNVKVTEGEVAIYDAEGQPMMVEICSVPLVENGKVVGVFGQVTQEGPPQTNAHPDLTPRQAEILRMLEHGRSTRQIADELHLSLETVRNHVRHLLRALGAHSRLEAVAMARQAHAVTA